MASATVLIMQQTQTQAPPDLPPRISDQKIPLHQDKIRGEDSAAARSFNRLLPLPLPSPSPPVGGRGYTSRSKKAKNGIKKQPQRGLGVAELEKRRLQEESRREQAVSCLAYAHMPIPLDRTCSGSFLHLQGLRPAGAYIGLGLSPKLTATARPVEPGAKTSPSPTILQRWDRFPATNSMALLRPPEDGNSSNTYPSSASSPFLLSKATRRVSDETRTIKAGMDVFSVKDHEKLGSSPNLVKLYTSPIGGAGAIKNDSKMVFVDLNAMESVDDDASSPPLRELQFLGFQNGSQSIDDNSSEELSSFQNNTYQTAWCQPNKTPSKKRSRDSTHKNSTIFSPRSAGFALSVVPSEDGARFQTEIQRNGAVATTDNPYFPNLKKQEMQSVCSPDGEDRCSKSDDITHVKDFLALSLSSSRFTTDLDCKQEVHEHNVQESNNIQISKAHKCSKIVRFKAFHQKDTANAAMTIQHQKMMGDLETKRFPSRDAPCKKLFGTERSTHNDSTENSLQISVLNVMTNEHQDHITHAGAEHILPEPDSQMNLSLDLSL